MTEKASVTVPSLSVSSWSSGSKASSSTSPPSTSKGERAETQAHDFFLHSPTSPWPSAFFFSVTSVENQQICTTWRREHTRLSSPSTGKWRQIPTRLRSFWRKCSVLRSKKTLKLKNKSFLLITDVLTGVKSGQVYYYCAFFIPSNKHKKVWPVFEQLQRKTSD